MAQIPLPRLWRGGFTLIFGKEKYLRNHLKEIKVVDLIFNLIEI